MPNLPGPYELEYQLDGWTSPTRSHVLRFNVIAIGNPTPGTVASSITLQKAGGGTDDLQTLANTLWGYLRLMYTTGISCTGFTLYKYVPGTYAKDFISAGTITTPGGTSGSITAAGQVTLSFRTGNGSVMKITMLETNTAGTTRAPLIANPAGTSVQRIAAFIMSVDNFAIGRDDSFPVNPLRDSRGENEKMFRLLYRS